MPVAGTWLRTIPADVNPALAATRCEAIAPGDPKLDPRRRKLLQAPAGHE